MDIVRSFSERSARINEAQRIAASGKKTGERNLDDLKKELDMVSFFFFSSLFIFVLPFDTQN